MKDDLMRNVLSLVCALFLLWSIPSQGTSTDPFMAEIARVPPVPGTDRTDIAHLVEKHIRPGRLGSYKVVLTEKTRVIVEFDGESVLRSRGG